MSASALDMHAWVIAFRDGMAAQLQEIHPSAQCICHEYFGDMQVFAIVKRIIEASPLLRGIAKLTS